MTNAQGGKFVISSLHTTRPPMSECRRQQIHGRILPMDRPLKDEGTGYDHLSIWDEQPTWCAGVGLLGLIAVLATVAAIIIP